MFDLYTTALSANGRKVLALALHLGLSPRVHVVNVYRGEGQAPEYLRINPSGKIPFLVDEKVRLSESNAILCYVSEAYGGGRLLPGRAAPRADVLRWLFWEAAHWQPTLIEALAPGVEHALFSDRVPAPEAPIDWQGAALQRVLAPLEKQLSDQPFVARPELTLADFSVAGMTTYFRAVGFPFRDFPALHAWCERIESLPAWQETAEGPWRAA